MIHDRIEKLQRYAALHPAIERACQMLENGEVDRLPAGSNPTGRDDMRCQINIYTTDPEDKDWEWHRKEADLQVMLEGEEKCFWSPEEADMQDPAFEKGDIAFTDKASASEELLLTPGVFVIYLPGELHKPGVSVSAPRENRKAVFKIVF